MIRQANASDVEALARLAAETFPLATPPGTPPEEIEAFVTQELSPARFLDHVTSDGSVVLVHDDGDAPAGYCLMFNDAAHAPAPSFGVRHRDGAFLSKLYVRASSHGGTVAAPLMDAAKVHAEQVWGTPSIWLAVNQQNGRAISFYEKHGFERVGVKTMQVGSLVFDDHVYEHRFPGRD